MSKIKIVSVKRPGLPGHYAAEVNDVKTDGDDINMTLKNVEPIDDMWSKKIKDELTPTDLLGNPIPPMSIEEEIRREVEEPYHYIVRPDYETRDVIAIMMTGKEMLRPIQSGYYFSALKYLDRFPFKDTIIKDLYKSIEFIKFLIEDIEKNGFREEDDYYEY